ncbi:MAG: tetratricopeptide repeat protein [Phycisphaerales bacterium]
MSTSFQAPSRFTAGWRRLAAVSSVVLACAMLPACASKSDTFELPDSARPGAQGEQIRKAHELASRAERAGKAQRYDEAIKLYQEALATYRQFPSAWLNLGVMQMKAGNGLAAAEAFDAAAEADPSDPRPMYNIGAIWEEKYYYDVAIRHYNKALERDPNFLPALRRSIYLEMQTNSFTPASKDRVRRALMLETDPTFKNIFAQAKLRLDNEVLGDAAMPN